MISYHSRLHSLEKIILSLNQRIENLKKKSNKFSLYRLTTFLTGLALSIAGFLIDSVFGWIIVVISVSFFSVIVHFHNKLLFGMRRCDKYLKIKEAHLARMNLEWENIPKPIVNTLPEDQTIDKDLDLVGYRSLHHLIDLAISYEGSLLLRHWISNTSPNYEIIDERQKIIKELTQLERFRDKFLLKAHLMSKKILKGEKILEWLKNSRNVILSKWLFPFTLFLILTYIALFILYTFEIIGPLWLIIFLIYFFVYSSNYKKVSIIIEESNELYNQFKKFASLIILIEGFSFKNYPALREFLGGFNKEGQKTSIKLKRLQKIISILLIRENPIIRIILNIVFPYDIYFCHKLIKQISEIENDLPGWLKTLNELECLISLSNFAFLNPDYIFPEFNLHSKHTFRSEILGHPLIKRTKKICNDFYIDKTNEIIIITGSNMSGKSTFLKTIGINLCLAYSGATVNASYFKTSLFELFTCIKINDSVADGISYFYAEVTRLKQLLDKFTNDKHLTVFFLIDEIFKGTNNKERLIGSRAFIKKLSQFDGMGAVSTHDLELINIAEEINSITNYHFKEEILNSKMHFDFKIHEGPCPTTNALKIMRIAGLPIN